MSENVERDLSVLADAWRRATPQSLRDRVAEISAHAADPFVDAAVFVPVGDWRRPVLRFGAGLVGATAILMLLLPGARLALARQAGWLLQVLQISPSTELDTSGGLSREALNASVRQHQRMLETGRSWMVSTIYGGFGGSVPEGGPSVPQRIDRADVLSSRALIPLLAPDAEHRGQQLVFRYAWLAPGGVVLAFFGFDDAEVFLAQMPVGQGQRVAYSRTICCSDGTTVGVAPAPEMLVVNGQQLTWDPDTTGIMPNDSALRWEANGVSYSLYGRALTRDEAVALFASLHPLH
jgi:hypothetical protein